MSVPYIDLNSHSFLEKNILQHWGIDMVYLYKLYLALQGKKNLC